MLGTAAVGPANGADVITGAFTGRRREEARGQGTGLRAMLHLSAPPLGSLLHAAFLSHLCVRLGKLGP